METKQNIENGHEYVDLGLSVKWATCNVGATKPEEYGEYFAWGETEQNKTYNEINYKFYINMKYSKYNEHDIKTVLDLTDDAARVNWGGAWRMPTDAEWTELRTKCTWTWTTINGINGFEVKGYNGNAIFLPAEGVRCGGRLYGEGVYGDYWSSSLDTNDPCSAWGVYFYSDYVYRNNYFRFYGLSVRPVLSNY